MYKQVQHKHTDLFKLYRCRDRAIYISYRTKSIIYYNVNENLIFSGIEMHKIIK